MKTSLLPVITDAQERPDICGPCGGKCCNSYPGIYAPSDFGSSESQIQSGVYDALYSKTACIDHWEGPFPGEHDSLTVYFVRARAVDDIGIHRALWWERCAHLRDDGCIFSLSQRPAQCRNLEPNPVKGGSCTGSANKTDFVRTWVPYADWLNQLVSAHLGYAHQGVNP